MKAETQRCTSKLISNGCLSTGLTEYTESAAPATVHSPFTPLVKRHAGIDGERVGEGVRRCV